MEPTQSVSFKLVAIPHAFFASSYGYGLHHIADRGLLSCKYCSYACLGSNYPDSNYMLVFHHFPSRLHSFDSFGRPYVKYYRDHLRMTYGYCGAWRSCCDRTDVVDVHPTSKAMIDRFYSKRSDLVDNCAHRFAVQSQIHLADFHCHSYHCCYIFAYEYRVVRAESADQYSIRSACHCIADLVLLCCGGFEFRIFHSLSTSL